MSKRVWLVPLDVAQIDRLIAALDSRLYEDAQNNDWPVNSGYVLDPRLDRLESEGPLTTMEEEICAALDEHDALERMLRAFTLADGRLGGAS